MGINPLKAVREVATAIVNKANEVKQAVDNKVNEVKGKVVSAAQDAFEKVAGVQQAFGSKMNEAKKLVGDAVQATGAVVGDAFNTVGANIGEAVKTVGKAISNIADFIKGILDRSTQNTSGEMTVKMAGTADANDVALVNAELEKIPEKYRQLLAEKGAQVVVVRDSITEYFPDLKGVQPRGWPPGSTWDSVTGCAAGKEAVIAVVGHGTGTPQLNNHGSGNVVLHEVGHVLDTVTGAYSDDFIRARNADMGSLSEYEKQSGDAGLQETFAESFARAFTDPNYKDTHPHLYAYWQSMPDLN